MSSDCIMSALWSDARFTIVPESNTLLKIGYRSDDAGASHLERYEAQPREGSLRLKFVGDGLSEAIWRWCRG